LLSPLRCGWWRCPPVAAVLSGHLDHAPAGDSVRLYYGRHYQSDRVKTLLSPAGDFKLVLNDLKAGTPITFKYAGQQTRLYLSPGDDLQLTLDFPRFDETVRYGGRGADANNYLAQSLYKFEYGPAGDVPRPQDQRTAATTPGQMRQLADAFRRQRQAFLAAYAKAHPLPADFKLPYKLTSSGPSACSTTRTTTNTRRRRPPCCPPTTSILFRGCRSKRLPLTPSKTAALTNAR